MSNPLTVRPVHHLSEHSILQYYQIFVRSWQRSLDLATGSAVVGIISTALHTAKSLHDDFNAVKNARQNIQPIINDLDSLAHVLSSLNETTHNGSQTLEVPAEMATNVGVAARDCHDICNAFRGKLNHWIRHPTSNGKMDLRDRFRIAWMGEKEVVLFNQQLVALKSTFTIVMLINT